MPVNALEASFLCLALALAGGGSPASAAPQPVSPARSPHATSAAEHGSLRSALESLQAAGLNLVFSSALVKAHYRLAGPVDETGPLPERAAALLAPFGLGLEQSGHVWYVVRLPAAEGRPAAAPAPAPAPRGRVVEEVVVSSARYRLVKDLDTHRRLDEQDLSIMPSIGRDLLRSVAQLPGHASVGISARSHMRGGNTDEVLYLLDGIEIIEPFHMGDFHALFSAINPGLVDAVNVYSAGFPVSFGSRLSGVVDMELAEPEEPVEGRINVDFVSAATHAQGVVGNTRWLVSARRSTVDYLLDYLERDYGRPTFHDELVHLAWEGDGAALSMGMLYGKDALSLEDSSAGESAYADYDNSLAWLRASRTLSQALELRVAGSFTSVDNRRWGTLNDSADAVGALRESRSFQVITLRTGLNWQPSASWALDAGLEGQRQTGEFEVGVDSRYGMLGDPLQPVDHLRRNVESDRDGTLVTAFVSAERRLGDAWSLELGARYDLQNIDPVRHNQFSPRLQLSYAGGHGWRAFLNAGRYAQHQNLYELQLDDGLLELHEPQIADQVSIGTEWSDDDWRVRLEAYWREIDEPWSRFENLYNRWVLLPELHADRIALAPDQARTYGGEMLLEYRPRDDLKWSLSWAAARARERFGETWRPRPWEQRRTLRAGLDWRPARWRLGVSVARHSGWPTTTLITGRAGELALLPPARLYDSELPDYFSLDLYTARRVELERSTLEVYLELSNLTFADNVGGYRYELEGRRWVRDERHLLPAVPVLGLSWFW